jgi:poly-gamma-glutamate system protein
VSGTARGGPRDPGPHLSDRVRPGTARLIVGASVVSAVGWLLLLLFSPAPQIPWSAEMLAAAERTRDAGAIVAQAARAAGVMMPAGLDPNQTGLIGPPYSELLTTAGQLEAKRTTTNPDLAGLIAHLLRRAGAQAGDTVAVGASASFPALLIASVVAAEELGVYPVVILSLGSSSYGATNPDYDLLHIYQRLRAAGAVVTLPAAVSLGGAADVGAEFEPAVRERLRQRVRSAGLLLLDEPDLRRGVLQRLEIYFGPARVPAADSPGSTVRIAAYINIGGTEASLGISPRVLEARPGLITALPLPPVAARGVLAEMAAREVPVIHLLNIRGLAERYGLPWDPVPLPAPGTTPLRDDQARPPAAALLLLTAAYLAALGLLAWKGRNGFASDPSRNAS